MVRRKAIDEAELLDVSEGYLTQDDTGLNSAVPDLSNLADRDQMIMALLSHGFSQGQIAKVAGISQGTVSKMVTRVDPAGFFSLGDEAKKAVIASRARSMTVEALSLITYEEMAKCTPAQQMKMAKTAAEIAAIQERKDTKNFGDKKITKLTVKFVDEIDTSRPIMEIIE